MNNTSNSKNNETKSNEFLQELKALLQKYNASIGFTCDKGSDTWGLSGDQIVVEVDDSTVLETESWWLLSSDINLK